MRAKVVCVNWFTCCVYYGDPREMKVRCYRPKSKVLTKICKERQEHRINWWRVHAWRVTWLKLTVKCTSIKCVWLWSEEMSYETNFSFVPWIAREKEQTYRLVLLLWQCETPIILRDRVLELVFEVSQWTIDLRAICEQWRVCVCGTNRRQTNCVPAHLTLWKEPRFRNRSFLLAQLWRV